MIVVKTWEASAPTSRHPLGTEGCRELEGLSENLMKVYWSEIEIKSLREP